VQKFNEAKEWKLEKFEQLHNKIEDKKEANEIINAIKICDPAVGSGHFLVSALNEIIAIKAELGILADYNGLRIGGYEVKIQNDELIITYNDNTEIFGYSVTQHSANREIQRLQKTIFHEKEII